MKRLTLVALAIAVMLTFAVPASADGDPTGTSPEPAGAVVDPADPSAGWNPIPDLPPPGVPPDLHFKCKVIASILAPSLPPPLKQIWMANHYTLCIVSHLGPVWPIG